jgi:selenocysteine lyase/cysteine desulfurase
MHFLDRTGMECIEREVLQLSARLRRGLVDSGWNVTTPPGEQSGIVTCQLEDNGELRQLLSEQHIVASVRAADVRISPHFFNTEDEIDAVLNVMETARRPA